MATRPLDLKPLTSLRIFAALWVVLGDYWADRLGAGPASGLVAHGHYGVELFFVLSGFILCHVYLDGFGTRRFSFGGFLWARLARVYPLHLATLAGVGLMAGAALALGAQLSHPVLYWPAFVPNLLLMNAWGFTQGGGWNHPAWSISAEWFAYLLFPVFAAAAWALRQRPKVALAGAACLLLAIYPSFERLAGFPLTYATIVWGARRIVPCFTLGCAVYLLWKAAPIRAPRVAEACSLAVVALAASLAALDAPAALVVASFGAVIFCLAGLTVSGSARLSHPWLVYLGEVSFAVYMVAIPWKMLVMSGAQKLLHLSGGLPTPLWALYFAGVIPVAMVAHHLVERPAREAMRKMKPPRMIPRILPTRDETSRNIA